MSGTIGFSYHAGDLFHVGHLKQLQYSARHCDYLIVSLLTDQAIASYKRVPIVPYPWRAAIYRALRMVDMVVPQDSRDPTRNLEWLKPDVLFHGDDWGEVPGEQWMKDHGGKVIKTPYFHPLSTTDIIEKCYAARAKEVTNECRITRHSNVVGGCGGARGPGGLVQCNCGPEAEKGKCACSDD